MDPGIASAGVQVLGGITAGIGAILGDKKVQIPSWIDVAPGVEQQAAIKENLAALPTATTLTSKVNAFQRAEFLKGMEEVAPGAMKAAGASVTDLLEGNLPADVQAGILRSGAARSLGLGVSGSDFGRNLTLRDLGLTTLQGQQMGLQGMTTLAGMMPQQFSVASMFWTPQQRAQITYENNLMKWQQQLMQAEQDAQPSGFAKFLQVAGSTMAGVGASGLMSPSIKMPTSAGGGGTGLTLSQWVPSATTQAPTLPTTPTNQGFDSAAFYAGNYA